jgi:hypothetical protein
MGIFTIHFMTTQKELYAQLEEALIAKDYERAKQLFKEAYLLPTEEGLPIGVLSAYIDTMSKVDTEYKKELEEILARSKELTKREIELKEEAAKAQVQSDVKDA